MIKKYNLENLDCPHCAQKIENKLNKREDVVDCQLSFSQHLLIIESREEIDISSLRKDIQSIEPDVDIILKHEHQCHASHTHHGHEHHHDHCDVSEEKKTERVIHKNGTINYIIQGLDCASCALKVEKAICELDNIEDASIHFSTAVLQVLPKESVNTDNLLQQLQTLVDKIEPGVILSEKDTHRNLEKPVLFHWQDNKCLVIGTIIYIMSFFIKNVQIEFFSALLAYGLIGYKVVYKAWKNIFRGEIFDENFLMVIATVGAFCIGEYGEAVAVMLFYSIGEIFQAYAVNKTRNSVSSLMDIKSEYANLKTDDGLEVVSPESLSIGDVIVVKVGEKVPIDGVVVKGNSTLDTSSLTGESLPSHVEENESILAGVVNLTDLLEIEVTHEYEDSTVAKILELMENAASKKAPIERFISKFAKIYTPTVVGLALLLAIVPVFIFPNTQWTDWLYRALTFLVVSCPCALVISIPLGLYAGLGKASQVGALIKGGNYLELLKDVDTIVFDKTGTLTHGQFEVIEVNGDSDLLMYGAYGEYMSNHPIAKSIVRKYNQDIDESHIHHFKEIAGKGIEMDYDNQHFILGNESFLNAFGIEVQKPKALGTVVYIAIDGVFKGSIVVSDTIKESAKKGIYLLKNSGIKNTVMLTGDHQKVAQNVAQQLGIDTVYSQLLPQDKVTKVESLLQQGNCVAFVGDGINDAPVLARADIGIAMGGVGSDAAIEAADIVLMQDNIETIKDAIDISHKTHMILIQNVIFTLGIKIAVLILTMFGMSNMWMGVFADVGVTLLAILNALRILK